MNRWFRFVIVLLALAAAGAAGYRIYQQERHLADDLTATRGAWHSADAAIANVSEIKAALHAYVAAGQGHQYWTGRAGTLIDRLRASLLELDAAAAAAGSSLAEALDLSDRLAASEQRARQHVVAGEALLAGEVIFNEARDLLDGLRVQIARGRDQVTIAADRRQGELRKEQAMLGAGAAGLMALALLLLLVAPARREPEVSAAPLSVLAPPAAGTTSDQTVGYGPGVRTKSVTAPAAAPTPSPAPSLSPPLPIGDTASLCTDLARIADSTELASLLDRAAKVIGASGIIVWMASPDGRELYPAASSGYDAKMFTRIGSIARDAANLTAAAYRDGYARTSEALGPSPAAFATPLIGPQGPVGVLSAELKDIKEIDRERLALAAIIAAQLATLLGSMTAAESVPPAQQAQA